MERSAYVVALARKISHLVDSCDSVRKGPEMNSSYVKALETKARWSRWLYKNAANEGLLSKQAYPAYEATLLTPDTHFMNSKFCDLVDHARLSVPDDLKFDVSWTHSHTGWLWLETPFTCPSFMFDDKMKKAAVEIVGQELKNIDINIRAIGWLPVRKTRITDDGRRFGEYTNDDSVNRTATAFMLFHEIQEGFGMWSYFTLADGDLVGDRIRAFEASAKKDGGNYQKTRETDMLHEIRWVYTAFHLMAQKLAIEMKVPTDRAQRKRAAREGRRPESVTVVSLRRLEAAREKAEKSGETLPIEWHCQWEVRGHWRNQFYPAANEHRQVFIEAYIKGPEDKPLKDPGKKLFAAVR
jgi:hypothetical protein